MHGWWVLDAWNASPVLLAAWVFWIIFAICLHELGHGWAAIWQGDRTPIAGCLPMAEVESAVAACRSQLAGFKVPAEVRVPSKGIPGKKFRARARARPAAGH